MLVVTKAVCSTSTISGKGAAFHSRLAPYLAGPLTWAFRCWQVFSGARVRSVGEEDFYIIQRSPRRSYYDRYCSSCPGSRKWGFAWYCSSNSTTFASSRRMATSSVDRGGAPWLLGSHLANNKVVMMSGSGPASNIEGYSAVMALTRVLSLAVPLGRVEVM